MYHTTHTAHAPHPGIISPAQLAQLAQYDRVGEYHHQHIPPPGTPTTSLPSDPRFMPSSYTQSKSRPHSPSPQMLQQQQQQQQQYPGGGGGSNGYRRQLDLRTETPPGDRNMPGAFGGGGASTAGGGILKNHASRIFTNPTWGSDSNSGISAGHGQLVVKSSTPPQTTSTAMVLAGQPQQQSPSHTHHMALVPAQPTQPTVPPPPPIHHQPPPPQPIPPVAAQATPTVIPAIPNIPSSSSTTTTTTITTSAPATSSTPTIKAVPSTQPASQTILIHIPLIPTPFRLSLPPPGQPFVLAEKINALLSNPQIQERISNALSVPKPNGWILVERVSAEYLQLRDLLGAIREGRLMSEGVVPWVCAGELVEGGVGYWCLGVCT